MRDLRADAQRQSAVDLLLTSRKAVCTDFEASVRHPRSSALPWHSVSTVEPPAGRRKPCCQLPAQPNSTWRRTPVGWQVGGAALAEGPSSLLMTPVFLNEHTGATPAGAVGNASEPALVGVSTVVFSWSEASESPNDLPLRLMTRP